MKITTTSEIKLIRKHLKSQLHYSEERIENEYHVIISGYRSWIASYVLKNGISYVLSFLMTRILRRRWIPKVKMSYFIDVLWILATNSQQYSIMQK